VPGAYRSVVGLVSLGAVGRITAEKLRNFELDVLAYDPFATPDQAAALGVRLVSLEEIFSQSDVVSLHTPWLPETENMINGRLLRMMKSGATLLNTSRGAVINEGDLCQVLRERSDLTAVLDVTHPEPPEAEGALFALDNVFMTPHISGSMGGEVTRMGRWMVDELIRHRNGEPLRYAVTEQMLATAA
jgi:phosphoglycerate dehydrogenase-like enzyme